MPMTFRCILLAALVAGAACGEPSGPRAAALQTDAITYTAIPSNYGDPVLGTYRVTLILTYRNFADTAVALDRCTPHDNYPMYSVELAWPSESAEGAAYDGPWACWGAVAPIIVEPSAVRIDTIALLGPRGFDEVSQRTQGLLTGNFRIAYGGRVSNRFTVKLQPGGTH